MEEFKFVEKERCAKMFSNPKGQSEEGNAWVKVFRINPELGIL